ncbi:MAG: tetratricopeptide repeat protein, partial [Acidobacteria bacterium]|nr:tetratricopeptide repeat protein [Acidobacteriota bacterium]
HKIPLNTQEILTVREHGLRFSIVIPARKPGTYFVRLAVKDQGSGRIGSAYQYVKIPDLKNEGLALSDLFAINGNEDVRLILQDAGGEFSEQAYSTGQNREKSPAFRQYQPGESLEYLALVYNAVTRQGSPPDLETRTVLYRDGGEIFRSDPEPVDTSEAGDPARIPIKKRMRLGKTMQPGDYILQLQVIDKMAKRPQSLAASSLDFQVIPEQEPTNLEKAETLIRRGNEANRGGKKEEAVQAFEEAARLYREELRSNPDDSVLWKQTGTVYFLAGQTDQAAAAYEEAVRLQPEDAESHYMLAIIRASIDVDSAMGEFREAIRLNPENAKYHFDLGRALAQKEDYAASIEAFREAARLNPEDGESHASMGIVLERMGEMEEAASEYRKALSLDLSDMSADSVRRLLAKALANVEDEDAEKRREFIAIKAKEWRSAVEQHIPGKSDAAAVEVGSWPVNDLDIIISLVGNIKAGKLDPIIDGSLIRPFRGREYIEENILPFLHLPDYENRLLKRAALLHTDIAMFQLDTGHLDEEAVLYRGIVFKKGNGNAISVQDGRGTGQNKGWHWEFARQLMAGITPHPSREEMVRKWYIAATSFMLYQRQFGYAEDNLASALEFFPSDPVLLFYSGVLHENYAAPAFQNALQPDGMPFSFGSENLELKQAMEYFQKALEINPEFSEARLHLGRVTGLLGNHDEAVEELQKAAARITDTQLRYYCSLYLGNELATLNRGKEAREQFEKAGQLYPKAQTPLLSLSRLALGSGDYENAMAFGKQIFTLPVQEDASEDPWWNYNISPARNASALISEMYEASGELHPETSKR